MAGSFDHYRHPESPAIATPSESTPASGSASPQKTQRRWSASTDGSKFDGDRPIDLWEAPPLPPIPPDQPPEAWRRRSMKRDSYTSRMSLRLSQADSRPPSSFAHSDASFVLQAGAYKTPDVSVRPASTTMSPVSTTMQRRCQYEELHWQISGLNPKGWTRGKKWLHTVAAAGVAFAILLASSIVVPASAAVEQGPSTSRLRPVLSTSLYLFGLAFGSILGSASSALVGRKLSQSASLLLLVAFTIASACLSSVEALHACRFFAGFFASPALWISHAIVCDLWPSEKLAAPLIGFVALSLSGLVMGPMLGTFISEAEDIRWTQYTTIIVCAVALALVLAMRETHKETLQRRKQEGPRGRPAASAIFHQAVSRPFETIFTSPTALLLCVFVGTALGTLYTLLTTSTSTLASTYGSRVHEQGLLYLSLLIGVMLGSVLLHVDHTFIYRPRVAKMRRHYDAEVERARAEEKFNKRRSRRTSRSGPNKLQKRKSTPSLFASSQQSPADSRRSLIQTPTKHDGRSEVVATPIDGDGDRNLALSVAAAEHLNSTNDKRILPERVWLLLTRNPPFGDLCDQLEAYGLRVDRVRLAQVFLDALQQSQQQQQPQQQQTQLQEPPPPSSRTDTRPTTGATTEDEGPHPAPRPSNPGPVRPSLLHNTNPTFHPPPHTRLLPALPVAALLAPAACLLTAWTSTRPALPWILPVLGLGLYACAAAVALVSATLFLVDSTGGGGGDGVGAGDVVVWVLAGAMVEMVAGPVREAVGFEWAGSVLGFIGVVVGGLVVVVVVVGLGLRGGRRR